MSNGHVWKVPGAAGGTAAGALSASRRNAAYTPKANYLCTRIDSIYSRVLKGSLRHRIHACQFELQKTGREVGWGLVGGEKAPTAKKKKVKVKGENVTENLKSKKNSKEMAV
jgi:hypothetical protein